MKQMLLKMGFTLLICVFCIQYFITSCEGRQKRDNFWNVELRLPWYLKTRRQDNEGTVMNIDRAWAQGHTGNGVLIGIVDPGGIDKSHKEFIYDQIASYDFVEKKREISGGSASSHGSKVAGLAAAKRNSHCGLGVAYDSKIASLRYNNLKTGASLKQISDFALDSSKANDSIDIFTFAWGPSLYGRYVRHLDGDTKLALKTIAEKGRNKKGGIMVFAAGNGGVFQDPCSYNDYVNSIYTIAISMINRDGTRSKMSQRCPSILAVTYTKDGATGIMDQSNPMEMFNGKLSSALKLSITCTVTVKGMEEIAGLVVEKIDVSA